MPYSDSNITITKSEFRKIIAENFKVENYEQSESNLVIVGVPVKIVYLEKLYFKAI